MRRLGITIVLLAGCGDEAGNAPTDDTLGTDVAARDTQPPEPETDLPPTERCLVVSPEVMDFGVRTLDERTVMHLVVSNACEGPFTIARVGLTESAGGRFVLEHAVADLVPLVVERDQPRQLTLSYTPKTETLPDGEPHRGQLVLVADESRDWLAIELVGRGTSTCPTARITCDTDRLVAPQSPVTCSGAASTSEDGLPVAEYRWLLTGPSGSAIALEPSATSETITFTPSPLGPSTLRLDVRDAFGAASCAPAMLDLVVTPKRGDLRIELTWSTPGDIVETDTGFTLGGMSVGSDVDLHVVHPRATAWFDDRWDAYWLNTTPNWAGAGRLDDPEVARDDSDGRGPEIFLLDWPEDGSTYTVGVHFWDDWGYGDALATVRVFVGDELRFAWPDVRLETQDLWSVCEIDWPSGEVRALGGDTPQIEPDYPVPLNSGWPF
ncbi:MAG: hypothetical protein IT385_00120 [Deltaproteobacteria bacterium]|nr:hypothetical protein [Deltaproteobacteria bacterium]